MKITFVTDFVCPYCYVAKTALDKALMELGIDAEATVLPFELTREPKPRVDTYHDATRKAHYQVLNQPCCEMGLDMKLPPNVVPRPYTRLAFEGMLFAEEKGKKDEWCHAMYHSYFEEELDIGNVDVLLSVCSSLGMDSAELKSALDSGKYTAEERRQADYTRDQLRIHSVPTIYIDGSEITLNDYSLSEMKQILTEKTTETVSGFACGIDGCGFSCGEDGCN